MKSLTTFAFTIFACLILQPAFSATSGTIKICVPNYSQWTGWQNYTGMGGDTSDYKFKYSWSATAQRKYITTGLIENISAKGVGYCSTKSGSPGGTSASLPGFSGFENAYYCWCQMTSPLDSQWVFLKDYNNEFTSLYTESSQSGNPQVWVNAGKEVSDQYLTSSTFCQKYCAKECADDFMKGGSVIRAPLFNSVQ